MSLKWVASLGYKLRYYYTMIANNVHSISIVGLLKDVLSKQNIHCTGIVPLGSVF